MSLTVGGFRIHNPWERPPEDGGMYGSMERANNEEEEEASIRDSLHCVLPKTVVIIRVFGHYSILPYSEKPHPDLTS